MAEYRSTNATTRRGRHRAINQRSRLIDLFRRVFAVGLNTDDI